MVLVSVEADPRVLPFIECPAAASEVDALGGKLLADLPAVGAGRSFRRGFLHPPERPAPERRWDGRRAGCRADACYSRTPSSRSRPISPLDIPRSSPSTISLCSPNNGLVRS